MNIETLLNIKETYNNANTETIKANIRQLLKETNTKQTELAELLKISIYTAYSYTKNTGKNKPDLFNLLILAAYFNVSIHDILT